MKFFFNELLKNFKNKRLLTQLFTVMAAFSAILMTVVSMVVAHQTVSAFINSSNLIYSNSLGISSRTLDTLFSGFHNSLTHITYDAAIVDSVITPKPLDSVANYHVWSVLNGYCQETEAIEEIYLYVKETDQILTSTYEKCFLEQYPEKELIKNHLTKPSSTFLPKSGRTTYIEMFEGNIYLVRDFPLNGEKGLGTLFMKLKPSVLYNSLDGAQTSFSYLLAYDGDWNPLFPGMMDYSLLSEENIEQLPAFANQNSGAVYLGNQHCFFRQSDQTNIKLVLLVDDFAFMPSFRSVVKNSLPFFALILILSLMLSACVLYLSYLPVQRLKKMVSAEDAASVHEEPGNEWDYLTESFLKISNHKYQLDYIISSMIPKISKEFYLELLNGKPMELSYIQSILTNINSPLKTEGMCKTIAVTLKETPDPALKSRLSDKLSQTLITCAESVCHYVWVPVDASLSVIILQFLPEISQADIARLEFSLEEAIFSVPAEGSEIWMESGPCCASLQNVSFSYQECLERLAKRKYPDSQKDREASRPLKDYIVPDHHFFQVQLKSICDSIMTGDSDLALEKSLYICRLLIQEETPQARYKACEFYRLAFLESLASYRITQDEQEEQAWLFQKEYISPEAAETPSLLMESMEVFCKTAISLLEEKYAKQQHKYLIRAKRYIEENYSNPDLSLNLLAEQCRTTTSYLSRLFKESFGINFVDYLNRYRIATAKELLLAGSRPVKDIAASTGFNSQQNFIRVFKKHTGMTPGQFKTNAASQKHKSPSPPGNLPHETLPERI